MTIQKILPQSEELKLVHYAHFNLVELHYKIGILWFRQDFNYSYIRRYFRVNHIAFPDYKVSDPFVAYYTKDIELGWSLDCVEEIMPISISGSNLVL